ncbi:MAG: hypothetical protein ACAH80_07975 [Alphaproteobacteria bacterium]
MHDETTSQPLKMIVGKDLEAVTFVMDYVQLQFQELIFTALAWPTISDGSKNMTIVQLGYRDKLCEQITQSVVAVRDDPKSITITLKNGVSLIVPLDADEPRGPEMAHLSGKGLFITAWHRSN